MADDVAYNGEVYSIGDGTDIREMRQETVMAIDGSNDM